MSLVVVVAAEAVGRWKEGVWGPAFHNSAAGWVRRAAAVVSVENWLRCLNFKD